MTTALEQSNKMSQNLLNVTLKMEQILSIVRFFVLAPLTGIPVAILMGVVACIHLVFSLLGWPVTAFWWFYGIVTFVWLAGTAGIVYSNISTAQAAMNSDEQQDPGTRWALGAREISRREKEYVRAGLERLALIDPELNGHSSFWVIDVDTVQAYTIGSELFLTRGAIYSEHLTAILAHEVAHLNNGDGKLVAALRAFTYPIVRYQLTSLRSLTGRGEEVQTDLIKLADVRIKVFVCSLIFGGTILIITRRRWAQHFKERDFFADDYVAKLGLAEELVSYLDSIRKEDQAVPFSATWLPATELRIDRLLEKMEEPVYTA